MHPAPATASCCPVSDAQRPATAAACPGLAFNYSVPLLFFCVINQGIFAALVVINSFPSERLLVLRERAAGTYYASAYFMAKVITAELATQLPIPVVFSCIVYWLVGLAPTVSQFAVFTAFMALCNMAATSLALMVSTWCRQIDMSIAVLPMALEISRLYGGSQRQQLPAQQSVSHFGGGYAGRGGHAGGREPALSKFNPSTKHYEHVTSDKSYTYFRLRVNLEETFFDRFTPDPSSTSVISVVISGNVYDNSTGLKAGTFDSYSITSATKATGELQYLVTLAAELGPEGDDTLLLQAALDRADNIGEVKDFDLAVTGGTGRYKGATGEAQHSGVGVTTRDNLFVVELAVPNFKRF